MIGDEKDTKVCRTCDAEFAIEGYNIDEEIAFCPYCGHMTEEFDEEFYDEDDDS